MFHFYYEFADVEQDAVLAAFTHDDIPLGTNYKGHVIAGDYQVLNGFSANITTWVYQRKFTEESPTTDEQKWEGRARLNLVWKFK